LLLVRKPTPTGQANTEQCERGRVRNGRDVVEIEVELEFALT
jgi:hypothetical protein